MGETIFGAADILLPPFDDPAEWSAYSVIACDQFTSEPEYWEKAEKLSGTLSTLDMILPEAYLGTNKEASAKWRIAEKMPLALQKLHCYKSSMVYVERVLPDGGVRRGIVGSIDLEEYDYTPSSASPVRATEKTVVERIPPRVEIRRGAPIELPHVMVFADDRKGMLIQYLCDRRESLRRLYDFDLMLGGGHITAYLVDGEILRALLCNIADYEAEKSGSVVYAMGDGNHSLASAKAYWEQLKADGAAPDHPARRALVELVDLGDGAIAFEPIYRLITNCDTEKLISALRESAEKHGSKKTAVAVTADGEREVPLPDLHPLAIGCLQQFLDTCGLTFDCDYIHGEDTLRTLSRRPDAVGFLCGGIEKSELFDYVTRHGVLPRKTFSMGEARSKRYYLEARKITF